MNKEKYREILNLLCIMFNAFFDANREDMYKGIEYAIDQLSIVCNIDIIEDEKLHKHISLRRNEE